jgi:RNA-directed DNA polymerase
VVDAISVLGHGGVPGRWSGFFSEALRVVVGQARRWRISRHGSRGQVGSRTTSAIERFEADLRGNLYKLWNRMSSGSYFPGPVRAVEIPKKGGTRILGIPNIVDRIAQTVAVLSLEPELEKVFHHDSFGYRPRRSALDAVAVCRERCFKNDWVVDMDIKAFFDTMP